MSTIATQVPSLTWGSLIPFVIAVCVIHGLHWVWNRLEDRFPPVGES